MVWLSKQPPRGFFGPDDYYEGMDVEREIEIINDQISEWHKTYRGLKLWDKIRLAFSDTGIMVK